RHARGGPHREAAQPVGQEPLRLQRPGTPRGGGLEAEGRRGGGVRCGHRGFRAWWRDEEVPEVRPAAAPRIIRRSGPGIDSGPRPSYILTWVKLLERVRAVRGDCRAGRGTPPNTRSRTTGSRSTTCCCCQAPATSCPPTRTPAPSSAATSA